MTFKFRIQINEAKNIILLITEATFNGMDELESRSEEFRKTFDKEIELSPYKLMSSFLDKITVTISRQQFEFESVLGYILNHDHESLVRNPFEDLFNNIIISDVESRNLDYNLIDMKKMTEEYLEDHYTKSSSYETLKRYESMISIKYSSRYIEFEEKSNNEIEIKKSLSSLYNENILVEYESGNIFFIPFVIIENIILHSYKIKKCEHCGKYFATKTLKQKYCTFNSTYEEFTHLKCKQAVKDISQKLTRNKKNIYTYICNNEIDDNKINDFLDSCKEYRKKINQKKSTENFKEYDNFLEEHRKYKTRGYKIHAAKK